MSKILDLGGRGLAVLGVASLLLAAPVASVAQTSQEAALASAITAAAQSVPVGADARARKQAVQDAIDTFIANNGVDPSVAPALITNALGFVAPEAASLDGVGAAITDETASVKNTAQQQANTANASSAPSTAATPTVFGSPSGSTGSGSGGSGGGGGGGGGSTPYGAQT